jgi:malonyl-CoA O-methyltransferase
MDKVIITRNFSKYAHLYDKYASVQKKTARRLLNKIPKGSFSNILELGSGTGNFTFLLRKKFADAEIKAVDISDKMVKFASNRLGVKKIKFIHADAENLNLRERFDLITSNACFHWFDDLEKALKVYKKYLKKDGAIVFTVFGPETFSELNAALSEALRGISTQAGKFINKDRLEKFLKSEFSQVDLREVKYKESFSSLSGLLKKIKYSGIRGDSSENKVSFSRRMLKDIEQTYLARFGRIKATYQVFFCKVSK